MVPIVRVMFDCLVRAVENAVMRENQLNQIMCLLCLRRRVDKLAPLVPLKWGGGNNSERGLAVPATLEWRARIVENMSWR